MVKSRVYKAIKHIEPAAQCPEESRNRRTAYRLSCEMQTTLEAAMPLYREPDDILRRDANDAPVRPTAHEAAGHRHDVVEWVAGAVFAFCLVATGWGIGQEPEMNAIQKAPANVLAANSRRSPDTK